MVNVTTVHWSVRTVLLLALSASGRLDGMSAAKCSSVINMPRGLAHGQFRMSGGNEMG
jgi:hypothetical protein